MAKIPKKTAERITVGLRQFQPIIRAARDRDINESDTVTLVVDLLHAVFGYDKYNEITSEHAIRGTWCDIAVKLDGTLALLIEVKAIGLTLKDQHVKQAVDYAANQGCDWVALTNGAHWRVYKVTFGKPIQHELVVDIEVLALSPRSSTDIELIALLAKEGWQKAHIGDYHSQRQALSRFNLAALLLSEPSLSLLRREIRRLSPDIRVEIADIKTALEAEVIKREVLEGDDADAARKRVTRAASRALRTSRVEQSSRVDDGPGVGTASDRERDGDLS